MRGPKNKIPDEYYANLLLEFSTKTKYELAEDHNVSLPAMEWRLHRARRLRDQGRFRDTNTPTGSAVRQTLHGTTGNTA